MIVVLEGQDYEPDVDDVYLFSDLKLALNHFKDEYSIEITDQHIKEYESELNLIKVLYFNKKSGGFWIRVERKEIIK